jgi:hypothetical protein
LSGFRENKVYNFGHLVLMGKSKLRTHSPM